MKPKFEPKSFTLNSQALLLHDNSCNIQNAIIFTIWEIEKSPLFVICKAYKKLTKIIFLFFLDVKHYSHTHTHPFNEYSYVSGKCFCVNKIGLILTILFLMG